MDLIKLVDAEIHETQQQLVTLRAQLKRSTQHEPKKSSINVQAVPFKEQATKQPVLANRNVANAKPLNHCAKRHHSATADHSIDSAISSAASSEMHQLNSPDTSPQTIPKTVWNSSPDDTMSTSSRTSSNAEERYLAKLKKMYQNRDKEKQIDSQPSQESKDNSKLTEFVVDGIVEKIWEKLQNIKPPQEKEEKELCSVAVETTFANQSLPSDDSDCDEESHISDDIQSIYLEEELEDENTVYMPLPNKKEKEKSMNHHRQELHKIQESLQSLSFFTQNEMTQYKDLEMKKREKPPVVLIDFDEDHDHVDHQGLNFSNTSHNTSMFRTLPEISSTCSTPKRRQSISFTQNSVSTIEQIRNFTVSNVSNQAISFSTARESTSFYPKQQLPQFSAISFSVDSMSREQIMSAISSSDVLDNDQFWEDVLDGSANLGHEVHF